MHGEKVANPADEVMPSSVATFTDTGMHVGAGMEGTGMRVLSMVTAGLRSFGLGVGHARGVHGETERRTRSE